MMLKTKVGVRLEGVQPVMMLAAGFIDRVYEKEFQKDGIITSGTEGKHGVNSLHFCGLALDFRTRFLDENQKKRLVRVVKAGLKSGFNRVKFSIVRTGKLTGSPLWVQGKDFDVILEGDHLHIELDMK
jgi:hypothetical protein